MTLLGIFQREIETIRTHYAGVLDGERGSIHDARFVTRRMTRRIRELLPLTHQWQRRDHVDRLFARRRLCRHDADMQRDLAVAIRVPVPLVDVNPR
ncbi:MAG TPA: hypothetical protein VKD69_04400 [Vicinamibacterales bacterium]|nr:hypothetical protein [Vicinamibacterales bacterium]